MKDLPQRVGGCNSRDNQERDRPGEMGRGGRDQNREADAEHGAVAAPVRKEPLRQRRIIREPRNASAAPQGERTGQHSNKRGDEGTYEASYARVSARAEAIDTARDFDEAITRVGGPLRISK